MFHLRKSYRNIRDFKHNRNMILCLCLKKLLKLLWVDPISEDRRHRYSNSEVTGIFTIRDGHLNLGSGIEMDRNRFEILRMQKQWDLSLLSYGEGDDRHQAILQGFWFSQLPDGSASHCKRHHNETVGRDGVRNEFQF